MARDSPTDGPTTDDLTIRRYEPRDAEAAWSVHEAAFRASAIAFVEDAPADADLRAVTDEYLDDGGEFLVGIADGQVVAIGGFRPRENAVELRRMRVHPEHQREGYGAALLSELEARAERRGFERVVLETHEDLTAARRLYEARGYEQTVTEVHSATGDELVRYRKEL